MKIVSCLVALLLSINLSAASPKQSCEALLYLLTKDSYAENLMRFANRKSFDAQRVAGESSVYNITAEGPIATFFNTSFGYTLSIHSANYSFEELYRRTQAPLLEILKLPTTEFNGITIRTTDLSELFKQVKLLDDAAKSAKRLSEYLVEKLRTQLNDDEALNEIEILFDEITYLGSGKAMTIKFPNSKRELHVFIDSKKVDLFQYYQLRHTLGSKKALLASALADLDKFNQKSTMLTYFCNRATQFALQVELEQKTIIRTKKIDRELLENFNQKFAQFVNDYEELATLINEQRAAGF